MRPWHGGTSDDVFRLTGSSVRRRRDTGVAGRVRRGRPHARRVKRRDARAPQSFLRGARRVVPAATTLNTRVFTLASTADAFNVRQTQAKEGKRENRIDIDIDCS